jgi:hypothetical protein
MTEKSTEANDIAAAEDAGFDAVLTRAFALLTLADLALLAGGAVTGTHPYVLVGAHVVLVLAAARRWMPAGGAGNTAWPLGIVLVLVAGPVGGIGLVILTVLTRRTRIERGFLDDWYRTLHGSEQPDPAQVLHEALLAGRQLLPGGAPPRRFADILAHGALAEKQAVLGHIGLHYHRDYAGLLAAALRRPEAGVRAQAAAVFVKLKERFRHELKEARLSARLARDESDGPALIEAARVMTEAIESGFLDAAEAREAGAAVEAICADACHHGPARMEADLLLCRIATATGVSADVIGRLMQALPAIPAALRDELARCLVHAGRHADLERLLRLAPPQPWSAALSSTLPAPPPMLEAVR